MQTKCFRNFLWLYMLVMFFISAYIYGIVLKANGDNVEHLFTSWQIWQGNIPYKDFFQHHNPLTWYLSAPFVAYLIEDINIFSIFNIVSLIFLYIIAFYQSKIILIDKNNFIIGLVLAAILISSYSLLWSTDYRPDTFMFAFFYMGLYYLFSYIKETNNKKLIISFLAFFISFMFTQKVLMHIIIPGMAVIYWLFVGKIKFKHFIYASIIPLILLVGFIEYLYSHDALKVYWLSNYPFNTYIPKIFEENRIILPPQEYIDFYIFIPLSSIATVYFLWKGNDIEKIFSIMFLLEVGIRTFYFSAFLHYVIFMLMLAIMLTVMFLADFSKEKSIFLLIGLFIFWAVSIHIYGLKSQPTYVLFIMLTIAFSMAGLYNKEKFIIATASVCYLLFMSWYSYAFTYKKEFPKMKIINGHELAFKVLTPCDYAINGYYATYNLKAKNPGYYSILLGQIDVQGEKVGIANRDNLNDLVRKYKPKLISAGVFWDTYWEQRGKKIVAHKIDPYLIKTYYDYSGVGDMHILKPQYQKRSCLFNGKEWKFMD